MTVKILQGVRAQSTPPLTAEEFLEAIDALGRDVPGYRVEAQILLRRLSNAEYQRMTRLRRGYLDEFIPSGKPEKSVASPSGKYTLSLLDLASPARGTWGGVEARVYRKDQDETLFVVRRNYPSFPFAWIEDHPDGHDYLVCGEDYQGMTMLQLDTGERVDYQPRAAFGGHGFCHIVWHPSPTKALIAVEGCYWGGPQEARVYDFRTPMSLPLPWISPDFEEGDFLRWVDDTTCLIGTSDRFCVPLGKWEADLTEEEEKEAGLYTGKTDEEYAEIWKWGHSKQQEWARPPDYECARTFALRVKENTEYRAGKFEGGEDGDVVDDDNVGLGQVLALLTDEEKDTLVGEIWGTV